MERFITRLKVTGNGMALEKIRDIIWCQSTEVFKNKEQCFKLFAIFYRKPVKTWQYWRDIISVPGSWKTSCTEKKKRSTYQLLRHPPFKTQNTQCLNRHMLNSMTLHSSGSRCEHENTNFFTEQITSQMSCSFQHSSFNSNLV